MSNIDFSKYAWVTYCLTQGTIVCYFCKTTCEKGLVTFIYNKNNAFCSGNFGNWKKWHEKLEKHYNSHFHREAVEKINCLGDANVNVGAQLNKQYKDDQERHRYLFLKQLSSLKYLDSKVLHYVDTNNEWSSTWSCSSATG